MKMKTMRKLRALPTRRTRRGADFDLSDATMEPDPGPPPEAVFDRMTGPWDRRRAVVMPGAPDEET
jgi:hypothetical protein